MRKDIITIQVYNIKNIIVICNIYTTDIVLAEADVLFIYFSQDPTDLDKFNLASFHHLKNNLSVVDEGEFALNDIIPQVYR